MMPTLAPTNSFSARWATCAMCRFPSGSAKRLRNPRWSATASAALDDTPLPTGTVDSIAASNPGTSMPSRASVRVMPCTKLIQ
jgi:hypothetical protein